MLGLHSQAATREMTGVNRRRHRNSAGPAKLSLNPRIFTTILSFMRIYTGVKACPKVTTVDREPPVFLRKADLAGRTLCRA